MCFIYMATHNILHNKKNIEKKIPLALLCLILLLPSP